MNGHRANSQSPQFLSARYTVISEAHPYLWLLLQLCTQIKERLKYNEWLIPTTLSCMIGILYNEINSEKGRKKEGRWVSEGKEEGGAQNSKWSEWGDISYV